MFKINGIDQLQRSLNDAQKALEALDGDLGSVSFNPTDPASIEAAILQVNEMVDSRAGQYASNPIVGPLVTGMKERYREAILQKAAEARLTESKDTE